LVCPDTYTQEPVALRGFLYDLGAKRNKLLDSYNRRFPAFAECSGTPDILPEFHFQGGNAMSDSDGGGSLSAFRPSPGRNNTAFPVNGQFH
jgi:hypothetical protein